MLYFITSKGLVSEEAVANCLFKSLDPLHPFIEVPLMKNQDLSDLQMGYYDFSDDIKYYQPAIVEHVIIRRIKKIFKRDRVSNGNIYYELIIQWFSKNNNIKGKTLFTFSNDNFNFEDIFSKLIPFINKAIENNDENLCHHLLLFKKIMGIRDGVNALFNPKINSNHISFYPVRNSNIESEYRAMKVSCRYTYQYRVGRDDYESEYMTITYKSKNSYSHELLYNTINKVYQTSIDIKQNGDERILIFKTWSDSNYGPSKKDYDYSEEECEKMKDRLITEINSTYKQYYEDFIIAYKKYIQ